MYTRNRRGDGLLGNLDEDILTALQQILNGPHFTSSTTPAASAAAGIVTGFVLIVIFIVGDRSILDHHIGGVQECGFFGADVHEGGLNAGEHGFDLPEVHVANHATGIGPIHQQLHQLAVLENGDARLARRRVHQDFSLHSDVPRAPAVATPLDRCGDEHGDRTEAARARQTAATRTTSRGSPNQHD